MASKNALKKTYADELAASSAPGPLLHMIYALSRDRTLSGGELVGYESWKGKRASGTQIAMAKKLLGIRTKAKKKAATKSKNGRRTASGMKGTGPTQYLKAAVKEYEGAVAGAAKRKQQAKRDYEAVLKGIDTETKAARSALASLKKML